LIIFVGGGCWRSRAGIKQILNLALLLMVVQIAKKSPSRKIMAPISFGPFAYDWQKRLSARIMSNLDLVTAREKLSFDLMKKLGVRNLKLSCDHGLLMERNQEVTVQENLVGFTIRNWSKSPQVQRALEQAYVQSLAKLQQKYNLTILPIVQVSLPGFPFEDDSLVVDRIYLALKEKEVSVLKPVIIGDVKNAMEVYSKLGLVLGMRMHSNIIAATQGVPFVAVSYEHKTEGIARQLSMDKFCLRFDQVNGKNLFEVLERAYQQRYLIKNVLSQRLKIIKSREEKRWLKILKSRGL